MRVAPLLVEVNIIILFLATRYNINYVGGVDRTVIGYMISYMHAVHVGPARGPWPSVAGGRGIREMRLWDKLT